MILTAHIFEVWTAYRSCLDDNDETDFWNDKSTISDDLINMFKRLHQKYCDFFNTWNADQLTSYQVIDHAINLKLNIKFLYMRTYNMFLTELKTLNNYFNNALVKEWIYKSQSSADTLILFVLWKSNELCLYINYCELNVIIIKNHYFLSLTSKLLDWLDDLTVFLKINLWNIYYRICIYENDE